MLNYTCFLECNQFLNCRWLVSQRFIVSIKMKLIHPGRPHPLTHRTKLVLDNKYSIQQTAELLECKAEI
jgi:hypothetical protein